MANEAPDKNTFAIKCAFCGKPHYSASCEAVTKLSDQKDILRKDGRCFVCLQFGHRASQCSRKCRQCNGKHHQSICEKSLNLTKAGGSHPPTPVEGAKQPENTPSITATTSDEDHVMTANQTVAATGNTKANKRRAFLQTATTQAYAEGKQVPVRILMDSGSQRTYITDSLKNELGLIAEKTEVLNLNTFGNDQIQKRKCD